MAETKVVYAVSSGEYSDYRVSCVFELREDAEQYINNVDDSGYRVEEFEFYSAGRAPEFYTRWYVEIPIERMSNRDIGDMYVTSSRVTHRPNFGYGSSSWFIFASGPDKERCVKSVSDRYARWKARQEGVG
jgi:hypothetical protein